MQPRFWASTHDWILENVADEIRAAKSAKWGIVFLEYTRHHGSGGVHLSEKTHGRLTRTVGKYMSAITVHKEQDDGSAAVLNAIEDWWSASELHIDGGIRVVGVNTEVCIAKTVNGLSKAKPDIEITVVGNACNGSQKIYGGGSAPNNDGQDQIVTDGRNVRVLKVTR